MRFLLADLFIHLLAFVFIDSLCLGLLDILALHLRNGVALLLVLDVTIPPRDVVNLVVTFWNIFSATLLLILCGNHRLLLVLEHVVDHRGALLVGVVMALLLDFVVIHSLVLSPALLGVLSVAPPLVVLPQGQHNLLLHLLEVCTSYLYHCSSIPNSNVQGLKCTKLVFTSPHLYQTK